MVIRYVYAHVHKQRALNCIPGGIPLEPALASPAPPKAIALARLFFGAQNQTKARKCIYVRTYVRR